MTALTFSVTAAVGLDVGVIPKLEKGPDRRVGPQYDAAAVATVAADRSALWLIRLAMPRDRAIPTGSRRDIDLDLIDELHVRPFAARDRADGLTVVRKNADDPASA